MTDFLDCAKELEQCRQQQSAADELQQRLDATMDQEALWNANQGQQPGGETGVPVEVLGYNNELGGYLVEERNGNISLMRSRSNAGLPTGAIVPAECEELVVPPAWVLTYLQQYPRTGETGGYWFVYKIEYFDAAGELTRTEFWLGGDRNRLLAEYAAYGSEEPVPFPTYSDSSGNASVSITGGLGTATATVAASANNDGSNISRFDIPQLKALAQIFLPGYRLNYAFTATSGSGSASGEGTNSASTFVGLRGVVHHHAGRVRTSDGYTKLQQLIGDLAQVEVTDWTTDNLFNPQIVELGIQLSAGATFLAGTSSITQTTTMQASAAKYTVADVISFTRSGNTVYCALRHRPADPQLSPTHDNLQISYFTVQQGVDEQIFLTDADIESGVAQSDWRNFMLSLDDLNDGSPFPLPDPSSENSCFEAYKNTRGANIENNILRQVEDLTAMQDALSVANAEIPYIESPVVAGASCATGAVTTGSRRAVKLTDPTPLSEEVTTTTTILWAAP